MKKAKKIIIPIIVIFACLAVFLIPIPRKLKDGGTVEYNAVAYSVKNVNSLYDKGYMTGTRVRILFWTVYDDVEYRE
ncbi:MAG: hypothetical protein J5856_06390 [Lachnospiraceae bacterium]|nr:hypothetical protein [Lachnospiraceae bacterium]